MQTNEPHVIGKLEGIPPELFAISKSGRDNVTKDKALDFLAQVLVEAYLKKKRNEKNK